MLGVDTAMLYSNGTCCCVFVDAVVVLQGQSSSSSTCVCLSMAAAAYLLSARPLDIVNKVLCTLEYMTEECSRMLDRLPQLSSLALLIQGAWYVFM